METPTNFPQRLILTQEDINKMSDPAFQAFAIPHLEKSAHAKGIQMSGAGVGAIPWSLIFTMAQEILALLAQFLAPKPTPPAA